MWAGISDAASWKVVLFYCLLYKGHNTKVTSDATVKLIYSCLLHVNCSLYPWWCNQVTRLQPFKWKNQPESDNLYFRINIFLFIIFDFAYKWHYFGSGLMSDHPWMHHVTITLTTKYLNVCFLTSFLCCLCVFDGKSSPFRRRVWRWWGELRLVECVSQVRRSKGEFVAITSATLSWWHTHSHTHTLRERRTAAADLKPNHCLCQHE